MPRNARLRAASSAEGHAVIVDLWRNPGGDEAGDSTIMLREALDLGLTNVTFGTIRDQMAVRLCHSAGNGAREIDLRFGGKTSAAAGDPVDAEVDVVSLKRDTGQGLGALVVPLGDCAGLMSS